MPDKIINYPLNCCHRTVSATPARSASPCPGTAGWCWPETSPIRISSHSPLRIVSASSACRSRTGQSTTVRTIASESLEEIGSSFLVQLVGLSFFEIRQLWSWTHEHGFYYYNYYKISKILEFIFHIFNKLFNWVLFLIHVQRNFQQFNTPKRIPILILIIKLMQTIWNNILRQKDIILFQNINLTLLNHQNKGLDIAGVDEIFPRSDGFFQNVDQITGNQITILFWNLWILAFGFLHLSRFCANVSFNWWNTIVDLFYYVG